MRLRRAALGTLAGLLALVAPAAANAALVVDQSSIGGPCSDARPAAQVSAAAPWCTIAHAVAATPSGSTVLVRAGSYPFQSLHGIGSRTSYVTLEPYGYGTGSAETVTIAGVSTANTSFLRFAGFRFVGSDSITYRAAIQVYLGSSNIQFVNNDVSGEGIQLQTASHVLLQGNYIHNVTRNCALTAPDGGGIFLTGGSATNPPANDLQVIGNTVQGTPQDAVNLVHNLTNVVVSGNDVSTTLTPQCGDHTDLVQIEGDAKGPFTIVNNTFHDGEEFILRNATGLTVENNLILRVQQWMQLMADPGARVINNTWWAGNGCPDGVHNCTAGSLLIRDYAPGSTWALPPFSYTNHMTGTVVENNVMREFVNDTVHPAPQTDYHEDYDLIYGPRQNNHGLQGPHTLFGWPVFDSRYRLAPGSPGYGAGDPSVAPAGAAPPVSMGILATSAPTTAVR